MQNLAEHHRQSNASFPQIPCSFPTWTLIISVFYTLKTLRPHKLSVIDRIASDLYHFLSPTVLLITRDHYIMSIIVFTQDEPNIMCPPKIVSNRYETFVIFYVLSCIVSMHRIPSVYFYK